MIWKWVRQQCATAKKANNVNHVVRTFSKPFFEIIVKYLFVAVITSMNNPKSNISTFITSAVSLIILKSLSFSNTLENFMGLRLQNEIFGNSNSPYFCFIRVFVGSLQYKYMIQVEFTRVFVYSIQHKCMIEEEEEEEEESTVEEKK